NRRAGSATLPRDPRERLASLGDEAGLLFSRHPSGTPFEPEKQNPASATRGLRLPARKEGLFDLGFLELDVLAYDGVVLGHRQLLGHRARILLRHVVETGVGSRDQLDLDGIGFCHDNCPWKRRGAANPAEFAGNLRISPAKSSRPGKRGAANVG